MFNILVILNPRLDRVDVHRSSYLTQFAGQDPNRVQRAYFLSPPPPPPALGCVFEFSSSIRNLSL